ncbi:MAG: chromosome partitioning protein ParA [Proteobacteria bacterium]|nr:chromosome partitioning protein ParA [Pseudomonadota bacterium]
MNPRITPWLRRTLVLALLLPLAVVAPAAFAQDASYVNPPGRVAQLNYFDGAVSFQPAGYDQWAAAVLNRPLTQGDRVWNDNGARSELHVGSTAVQMSGQTSVEFTTLDDQTVQLAVTQGSVAARVRELPAGQRFEIDTPNLALTASQPGEYQVDVDPGTGTTTVTVRSGSVQVFGASGVPLGMPAGEQIGFAGNDLQQIAARTAPPQDAFGRWAAARNAAEDRATALRYVPPDMTGYQQLDGYGTWESNPEYGEIWVPTVTVANWAPYRFGHWAYIAPWGWTWIDDQPWGFAPFHYGRWAMVGPRWCWVPGPRTVRPVYAPALVAFVGGAVGGVNFRIGVGGAAQPAVGWFPLGPGEVWHPGFRASPTYVREANRTVIMNRNVTNITNVINVNRVTNVYRYQNTPQAVTAVSEKTFTQGQHLRGNTVPVTATELARARVTPPPAPTRDPRAIFAGSRVAQPHPAPPPAVTQRRVLANPQAISRERGAAPETRGGVLPGQPQQHPAPQVGGPLGPHRMNESVTGPRAPATPNVTPNATPHEQGPRPPEAARIEPRPQPLPPQQVLRQPQEPQRIEQQRVEQQRAEQQRLQQQTQQRDQQQRVQQQQQLQRDQAARQEQQRQQQEAQQRDQQLRLQQQRTQQEQLQRDQAARQEQQRSEQAARAAAQQAQQAQRVQMEQQARERQNQVQQMRQNPVERAAPRAPAPQQQARPQQQQRQQQQHQRNEDRRNQANPTN